MILHEMDSHPYSKLDLSNFEGNRKLSRHRWFEFKEGFSADLVRLAVADLGRRCRPAIIDTFAGSGTTLVEAGRIGLRATGIEVNPFLSFAASAKIAAPIKHPTHFSEVLDRLIRSTPKELPSPLEGQSTFTERPKAAKWLFNLSVLRGFTALQHAIRTTRSLVRPFELALLCALLDCSNAKRDGKCLRYKEGWADLGLGSDDLRASFREKAFRVIQDLSDPSFDNSQLGMMTGDCRVLLDEIEPESHDLWITSPPYLNSFDYSDVYRPEMFASGFVKSNEELRAVRISTVSSHVQVKRNYTDVVPSVLLDPVFEEMSGRALWNKNIPAMIRTYFADLAVVLSKTRVILKRGGKAWIVVSTSAYAGVEIPVDLILADVASKAGWNLCGVYTLRRLRAAGQYWNKLEKGARPPLRESLIVLEK